MVWDGTVPQLSQFMEELNSNNRNLRLTYTYHHETLPFLDLTIGVQGGLIVTKTYHKQTAANTLLEATSHHPCSLIQGIPVGQFLRIKRNCYWKKTSKQKLQTCTEGSRKEVTRTNVLEGPRKGLYNLIDRNSLVKPNVRNRIMYNKLQLESLPKMGPSGTR